MTAGLDAPDTAPAAVLEPTLLAWVEQLTGGRVVRARRMDRWRPNYFVDVAGAGGEMPLFLKGPRVPPHVEVRSRMLSGYGTRREAAALAALQGSGVAVPQFHAFLPEAGAMLIGRVPGSGVLQPASAADRASLMRQYAEQLAATHRLDPEGLGVRPGLEVSADPTGPDRPGPLAAVMADYDVLRPKLECPDPLIDLALWWLRRNAPTAGEVCVLHGDAGPNQFMFDGDRLTALLDWELAHLGHPMSDLGYTRFREALYPSGAFAEFVDAYAVASGRPVDRRAVDYFTVVAGLLMLAGISSDVHRPKVHNPEALQRFWWDALARVGICQVLGESLGLPPLELRPGVQLTGEMTTLATLLTDRLDAEPSTSTVPGGSRHTLLLARTLLRATRLQPDAADAAELLGYHLTDPQARHAELAALVRDHAGDRLDALVVFFGRQAVRRLDATAPLADTDTWDRAADTTAAADDARVQGLLLPAFPRSAADR
ncbi:MAG: aminoglycoside phosphotransferase [Gemmatimonadales bacterium]|jgi:aminoglycoside phosphotransferase (APT) family kinase protein|nr:aminoglycoside phosphotransferase [Gemmatimonadales bacterium]